MFDVKMLRMRQSKENDPTDAALRTQRRVFLLSRAWLYPMCVFLIYQLSYVFVPFFALRWILSLLLAIFPFISIVNFLYSRRTHLLRLQAKVMFQSLCTSVSGGYSLETSFMLARPALEKAFGKKCAFAQALSYTEKALQSQVALERCVTDLCYRLDYIEMLPILHALSASQWVGNAIISVLRNSCQMLSELIAVSAEVQANHFGRYGEAAILCIMPFGVTFALYHLSGSYMVSIFDEPMGLMLMSLAFILAIISCTCLFSILAEKKAKPMRHRDRFAVFTNQRSLFAVMRRVLCSLLPGDYLTRLFSYLSELSCDPKNLLEREMRRAFFLSLFLMTVFGLIFFLTGLTLYYLIGIMAVIVWALHHDFMGRIRRRREALMDEMPLFLSLLSTLMQSGMLLNNALLACSMAFPKKSAVARELIMVHSSVHAGKKPSEALEQFSQRTPIPEAQAALLLAARYESSGGREILNLLAIQASSCWSLCRNASRKRRERDALAMVFPMMLDFICVLIVALTPALLSLKPF